MAERAGHIMSDRVSMWTLELCALPVNVWSPVKEAAQLFIYMGVSVCVCLHTHRHQGWTSTTFFRSSLSFRIFDQNFLCISFFPYVYVPHTSFTRLYHPNNMWKNSNYEPPDYEVFFTWVHMFPSAPCSRTPWILPLSFTHKNLQM